MKELNGILDKLKQHVEETLEYYAEKEKWEPQDLKCAKEAAELYDKIQNIQMNKGIWDNINHNGEFSNRSYGGSYDNSFARYPNFSYGDEYSYMRGRDANTGRYMSRNDMYHGESRGFGDDGYSQRNSSRENRGGQGGSSRGGNNASMHSVKDQAIQRLENLMDDAGSEYEREEVLKMIKAIEKQPR